jgi:hypothetical protein
LRKQPNSGNEMTHHPNELGFFNAFALEIASEEPPGTPTRSGRSFLVQSPLRKTPKE